MNRYSVTHTSILLQVWMSTHIAWQLEDSKSHWTCEKVGPSILEYEELIFSVEFLCLFSAELWNFSLLFSKLWPVLHDDLPLLGKSHSLLVYYSKAALQGVLAQLCLKDLLSEKFSSMGNLHGSAWNCQSLAHQSFGSLKTLWRFKAEASSIQEMDFHGYSRGHCYVGPGYLFEPLEEISKWTISLAAW